MTRVLSGILLAAAFFSIVWFSSATVLLGVAMGVCVLAWREYVELMGRIGTAVPPITTLIATLATLAAVAIVPFPEVAVDVVIAIGFVAIAVVVMVRLQPDPGATAGSAVGTGFGHAIRATAAGALCIVYLGVPLGALVASHVYGGPRAVLLLVGTIAVSDTTQYYSGRLLGRHPLAPRLSPKKTIEGAIGGLAIAPIFLYVAGPYLVPLATPWTISPLGLPLVAAGIAGDLFESMIKRAADVKDSSTLIPGHGGVLDRIDALLFATPVYYVYLRWLYTP